MDVKAKAEADVLLFVIGGLTRAVASIGEVAYLLAAGRPLALAINDVPKDAVFYGQAVEAAQRDDLNRGRQFVRTMAAQHGVPVFASVEQAVQHAIRLAQEMRPALSADEVRAILAKVRFRGLEFCVSETADGFFLRLHGPAGDADSGQPASQLGRRWHLARDATQSEIVRTAFKAVLTWLEHEAREFFTYQEARVFGPHLDVDRLAALCLQERD
jgi:hypothetical protein